MEWLKRGRGKKFFGKSIEIYKTNKNMKRNKQIFLSVCVAVFCERQSGYGDIG